MAKVTKIHERVVQAFREPDTASRDASLMLMSAEYLLARLWPTSKRALLVLLFLFLAAAFLNLGWHVGEDASHSYRRALFRLRGIE
jgi:hypothetical protein